MSQAPLDDAYLASISRSLGIPLFWQEDAAQEMRTALWLAHPPRLQTLQKVIARRAAIDFWRYHGPLSRSGLTRAHGGADVDLLLPADQPLAVDVWDAVDAWLDLQRIITPRQLEVLRRVAYGYAPGVSDSRVAQMRKRLRELRGD